MDFFAPRAVVLLTCRGSLIFWYHSIHSRRYKSPGAVYRQAVWRGVGESFPDRLCLVRSRLISSHLSSEVHQFLVEFGKFDFVYLFIVGFLVTSTNRQPRSTCERPNLGSIFWRAILPQRPIKLQARGGTTAAHSDSFWKRQNVLKSRDPGVPLTIGPPFNCTWRANSTRSECFARQIFEIADGDASQLRRAIAASNSVFDRNPLRSRSQSLKTA
eukprot:COSAG02_NODE_2764_length_8071_cov_2.367536_8_plen_215_part_00